MAAGAPTHSTGVIQKLFTVGSQGRLIHGFRRVANWHRLSDRCRFPFRQGGRRRCQVVKVHSIVLPTQQSFSHRRQVKTKNAVSGLILQLCIWPNTAQSVQVLANMQLLLQRRFPDAHIGLLSVLPMSYTPINAFERSSPDCPRKPPKSVQISKHGLRKWK